MLSDAGDLPIYLIITLALLILQAMVKASMGALDAADRNKIKEMLDDEPENKKIIAVMDLLKKPSKYHYANLAVTYAIFFICLLLINLTIVSLFSLQSVIALNVLFYVVYVALADILPKKLAVQNSERYSLKLVSFQYFIYYISLPVVSVCKFIANAILFIMRKETDVDDLDFSEEKVMSMLDKGQETGNIKEEGRKMISSIFEFDDLLAYEIMTPRTDVFMIDINDDKDEYFDELMELTHSRIPVYDGDHDNIIGILHIKDYLFKAGFDGFDNVNISEILREPYFVPETKNIDSLFIELQKSKNHLALLIDEYGGFSGIVSVEDIIEQIVGDIDDEFDEDDRVIEKIDDTEYIVDGKVYLDDLCEETGVELESENSETIGGFIIDLMGEIPKEDIRYEPLDFENYSFTIMSVRERRIEKVRIKITDKDFDKSDDKEK